MHHPVSFLYHPINKLLIALFGESSHRYQELMGLHEAGYWLPDHVVMAMLVMLAFLVDQTQELCCPLFQSVHKKLGSRRAVWDHLRSHFRHFQFRSMQHLYEVMLYDLAKELPAPTFTSRRLARVP